MLKRFFAVAIAAAMIFGLASTAFAGATLSDIAGHKREAAIKQLVALGILGGYPDGTFKPDNTITRAEIAKVVIVSLGQEDAAELMEGVPTSFSDVPADHWACGYINLASSQDIVKGYPDGTFRPSANVTYAEALAMILRALGYDPVLKNGVWPTAYVLKASSLGVSKGVSFSANGLATRGDVAAFVANALTVDMMEQTGAVGDDPTYEVGTTCLLDILGAEKYEGWLLDSPDLFDNPGDEITVDVDDDGAEVSEVLTLGEDVDVAGLLGHKVTAWKIDGEVLFVQDETDPDEIKSADYVDVDEVEVDDEDYVIDGEIFVNYGSEDPELADGDEITVIFDGDTAKHAVALRYTYRTVSSVNKIYDRLYFEESGSASFNDFDVTLYGDVDEIDDIKAGDVVQYIRDADTEKAIIIVTRNSVTGEFTRLSGTTGTVGGTKYGEGPGFDFDPSLLGEDVTVYLNKDGKVQFMEEVDPAAADELIGVVVDTGTRDTVWSGPVSVVKLFTADGEVLEADCTEDFGLEAGDVIEYTLDDGDVDSATILGDLTTHEPNIDVDGDDNLITDAVGTFRLTSGTLIFDMSSFLSFDGTDWSVVGDEDDLAVADLDDLLALDEIDGFVIDESGKATLVCIGFKEAEADTGLYGYVLDEFLEGDDDTEGVVILAGGVESEYLLSADNLDDIEEGDIVKFDLSGGEIEAIEPVAADETAGQEWRVTDISDDVVEVTAFYTEDPDDVGPIEVGDEVADSTEYLLVDGDTLFFDDSGSDPESIDLDDVALDSVVKIYVDGSMLKALVVVE